MICTQWWCSKSFFCEQSTILVLMMRTKPCSIHDSNPHGPLEQNMYLLKTRSFKINTGQQLICPSQLISGRPHTHTYHYIYFISSSNWVNFCEFHHISATCTFATAPIQCVKLRFPQSPPNLSCFVARTTSPDNVPKPHLAVAIKRLASFFCTGPKPHRAFEIDKPQVFHKTYAGERKIPHKIP